MKFQIRSLLLVIAGLAPAIYAGTEGWKAGCLLQVLVVWTLIAGVPLLLLWLLRPVATSVDPMDKNYGVIVVFAIISYGVSILMSIIIIGMSPPFKFP